MLHDCSHDFGYYQFEDDLLVVDGPKSSSHFQTAGRSSPVVAQSASFAKTKSTAALPMSASFSTPYQQPASASKSITATLNGQQQPNRAQFAFPPVSSSGQQATTSAPYFSSSTPSVTAMPITFKNKKKSN